MFQKYICQVTQAALMVDRCVGNAPAPGATGPRGLWRRLDRVWRHGSGMVGGRKSGVDLTGISG